MARIDIRFFSGSMEIENPKGEPSGYFVVVPGTAEPGTDLDLRGALRRLWRGRFWLIAAVLLGGALGALHAFTATRIYRSDALLAVRSGARGPLSMLSSGQLGGIASLAGIDLGDASDQRTEYIAFLKSRDLERDFIRSQGLMKVLFSSQWDSVAHTFRKNWRGEVPSLGAAVKKLESIRHVQEERSGLLTVSFEWRDPVLASRWVGEYVALANERLRHEAMDTAEMSLDYLKKQLAQTSLEPLRQSLFGLIERRLNEAMVASVQHDYAFKVIDHAETPERDKFVRPMRLLDVFLGVVLGFGAGAVLALWRSRDALSTQTPEGRTEEGR